MVKPGELKINSSDELTILWHYSVVGTILHNLTTNATHMTYKNVYARMYNLSIVS